MASTHFVAGACLVSYGTAGTELELGYTRDGAVVRHTPFYDDIKSDDFGGEAGMPSDSQILGGIVTIELELVKFEASTLRLLSTFDKVTTAAEGVYATVGTLVRQGSLTSNLTLVTASETYDFPQAFVRGPVEYNVGVKYRTALVEFECWINDTTNLVQFTRA